MFSEEATEPSLAVTWQTIDMRDPVGRQNETPAIINDPCSIYILQASMSMASKIHIIRVLTCWHRYLRGRWFSHGFLNSDSTGRIRLNAV